MGQILFSPGLRMMRSGPPTEKQDHECNAKQAGQENSSRLQIEPVLSNGPEQDNPDQKGQDIGHCCWVSSITVHLIVSLSLHLREVAVPGGRFQPGPGIDRKRFSSLMDGKPVPDVT